MPPISNAGKQERFRKKELLKRYADRIFREWELSLSRHKIPVRTPQEVRHTLDKAVALPSGWTDEDYTYAEIKLKQYQTDLQWSVDQISKDVDGDWELHRLEWATTTDPVKFFADNKAEKKKVQDLASHIISALNLSNCNDAGQAAALMEAMRYVGRSLVSNRTIHNSQATTMCLASIGPQYDRPEWFAEKLAKTIGSQIDQRLSDEVGRHLRKSSQNDPQ